MRNMTILTCWCGIAAAALSSSPFKAAAYNPSQVSRRSWFASLASATAAVGAGTLVAARPAAGAAPEGQEDVYFGVGCFWHIQHEFVQAERELLGRGDHDLTSAAGYAGGKAADREGRVCYHNMQLVADYGKLGHGEVVGMKLPQAKVADFAQVYFSLFSPVTKDRVDPADRGGEYRSLMGLPGGTEHPAYPKIEALASDAGFKLVAGKGNDPDTLGKQIVYVYDTAKFPF